jgi:hypothetical protein
LQGKPGLRGTFRLKQQAPRSRSKAHPAGSMRHVILLMIVLGLASRVFAADEAGLYYYR